MDETVTAQLWMDYRRDSTGASSRLMIKLKWLRPADGRSICKWSEPGEKSPKPIKGQWLSDSFLSFSLALYRFHLLISEHRQVSPSHYFQGCSRGLSFQQFFFGVVGNGLASDIQSADYWRCGEVEMRGDEEGKKTVPSLGWLHTSALISG